MADYGHDLLFGAFVPPVAEQSETIVTLARIADASGLDLFTVQDHPYQPRFLDTWTLLSYLAADCPRIAGCRSGRLATLGTRCTRWVRAAR